MVQGSNPSVETLRKFSRLSQMPRHQLEDLSNKLTSFNVKKGGTLIAMGANDDTTLYLVEGSIMLQAEDGGQKVISHTDAASESPISRLRPSRYEVTALTPVRYLVIENDLLDEQTGFDDGSSLMVNSQMLDNDDYQVAEQDNPILLRIYKSLNDGQLFIPSIQEYAQAISQHILDSEPTIEKMAQLLLLDPAMVAKLLRLNAMRTPQTVLSTSCSEAICNLGIQDLEAMVVKTLFKETVRSNDSYVNHAIRNWWEHSIKVSAVSRLLAKLSERFNPQCAAIAGLLQNIGEAVILGYSRNHPEIQEDITQVEMLIQTSANEIGASLLRQWRLPEDLVTVVNEAGNWFYHDGAQAEYTDLVIMAQFFTELDTTNASHLPNLDKIPAYHKLGLDHVSADFSQQIIKVLSEAVPRAHKVLKAN